MFFSLNLFMLRVGLKNVQIQTAQHSSLFIMISDILRIRAGFSWAIINTKFIIIIFFLKKVFGRSYILN